MQTRRSFLRTSLAATTAIFADVSSIVANESPTISKSPSNPSIDGVKFFTPEAPDYAIARKVYNAAKGFGLRGHFLNPKSPLTHLNENRGFYDSRFQVCAAAASQGAGVHGSSRIDALVGDWS